jgi:CheY-like chemotaxis protein
VLLAEDNDLNRVLESELVRRLGHDVTAVTNGREAVDAAALHEFDLVLMNISMPEMNGIDATRAIRRGDGHRCSPEVPVVAITGHAMEGDRERFLKLGVDDYLPKPFGLKDLATVLRKWQACLRIHEFRPPG